MVQKFTFHVKLSWFPNSRKCQFYSWQKFFELFIVSCRKKCLSSIFCRNSNLFWHSSLTTRHIKARKKTMLFWSHVPIAQSIEQLADTRIQSSIWHTLNFWWVWFPSLEAFSLWPWFLKKEMAHPVIQSYLEKESKPGSTLWQETWHRNQETPKARERFFPTGLGP